MRGSLPARRLAWLVALACVLLGGCGLGFVYPRLDTLGAWYVESLVSLDAAQSTQLERLLEERLDWHRDSELVRYANFLRDLSRTVQAGSGAAEWDDAARRTEELWRGVGAGLAPVAVDVGRTFSDAQVEELIASLEERDEERWREYAGQTPVERVKRRQDSMRRGIERFTGRLDARQRAMVDESAARAASLMPAWREYRRAWLAELAATLEARREAGYVARMTRLVARPDEWWTPAYRDGLARRRAEFVELLARLDATLSASQRAAAHGEFAALAGELDRLARADGRERRS